MERLRLLPALLIAVPLLALDAPDAAEIETAYRSRTAAAGFGPLRIESRRVRDIRGWRLSFKRLSQSAGPVATSTKTRVTARHGSTCAAYLVTDTVVFGNPRVKPVLHVEPLGGAQPCR